MSSANFRLSFPVTASKSALSRSPSVLVLVLDLSVCTLSLHKFKHRQEVRKVFNINQCIRIEPQAIEPQSAQQQRQRQATMAMQQQQQELIKQAYIAQQQQEANSSSSAAATTGRPNSNSFTNSNSAQQLASMTQSSFLATPNRTNSQSAADLSTQNPAAALQQSNSSAQFLTSASSSSNLNSADSASALPTPSQPLTISFSSSPTGGLLYTRTLIFPSQSQLERFTALMHACMVCGSRAFHRWQALHHNDSTALGDTKAFAAFLLDFANSRHAKLQSAQPHSQSQSQVNNQSAATQHQQQHSSTSSDSHATLAPQSLQIAHAALSLTHSSAACGLRTPGPMIGQGIGSMSAGQSATAASASASAASATGNAHASASVPSSHATQTPAPASIGGAPATPTSNTNSHSSEASQQPTTRNHSHTLSVSDQRIALSGASTGSPHKLSQLSVATGEPMTQIEPIKSVQNHQLHSSQSQTNHNNNTNNRDADSVPQRHWSLLHGETLLLQQEHTQRLFVQSHVVVSNSSAHQSNGQSNALSQPVAQQSRGIFYLTNFRIIYWDYEALHAASTSPRSAHLNQKFNPAFDHASIASLPLHTLSRLSLKQFAHSSALTYLKLYLKTTPNHTVSFLFERPRDWLDELARRIAEHAWGIGAPQHTSGIGGPHRHLFAFAHHDSQQPHQPPWEPYDALADYRRLELLPPANANSAAASALPFRLTTANAQYELCPSYPPYFVVPSCVSDSDLPLIAIHRSNRRLPVITYRHRHRPNSINNHNTAPRAIMLRCSQPMVGMKGKRSEMDEKYFEIVRTINQNTTQPQSQTQNTSNSTTKPHQQELNNNPPASHQQSSSAVESRSNDRPLFVIDARNWSAAMGNAVMGKGFENTSCYNATQLLFMCIDNIHAVRTSLEKLCTAIMPQHTINSTMAQSLSMSIISQSTHSSTVSRHSSDAHLTTAAGSDPSQPYSYSLDEVSHSDFLLQLHASSWLFYVQLVLAASVRITHLLTRQCSNVIVRCSDGWDRTSQLTALTQLMCDPHYRTFDGFHTLVEKEFCSFGHRFSERLGHGSAEHAHSQRSPIFLQFLDCVFQLLHQFPSAFEFHDSWLIAIYDALLSCQYGNFLCNTIKERQEANVYTHTRNMWPDLKSKQSRYMYMNPHYVAPDAETDEEEDQNESRCNSDCVLVPSVSHVHLVLWSEMYSRFTRTYSEAERADQQTKQRHAFNKRWDKLKAAQEQQKKSQHQNRNQSSQEINKQQHINVQPQQQQQDESLSQPVDEVHSKAQPTSNAGPLNPNSPATHLQAHAPSHTGSYSHSLLQSSLTGLNVNPTSQAPVMRPHKTSSHSPSPSASPRAHTASTSLSSNAT